MSGSERAIEGRQVRSGGTVAPWRGLGGWLLAQFVPLAQPRVAALVALAVYLFRAGLADRGLQRTDFAYFNLLADAFLHGQLHLRLPTVDGTDLVNYGGRVFLHFPPFPALLVLPLVALFGAGTSDVVYTVTLGAVTVGLLAHLLAVLDRLGIAPLPAERRAILVATCAFGTFLLILVPVAEVWYTVQVVGWACVLCAALAALTLEGKAAYFLTGLALAAATGTRFTLLFNGVWLAFYLLQRDRRWPWRDRLAAAACGLAPIALTLLLLGWYNIARFGSPLETGWAYHNANEFFRDDLARYGVFHPHYLWNNIYRSFLAYDLFSPERWLGGGLFWMTPVFLAAPYAVWIGRRRPLVWALVATCAAIYAPLSVYMSTGWLTFGPRYMLDLLVPLLILTAQGVRRWRLEVLFVLLGISCATYAYGSWAWLAAYQRGQPGG